MCGANRTAALERSCRRHALLRECDDLHKWMELKQEEAAKQQEEELGKKDDEQDDGGLELVEKQQKKLDEFQKVRIFCCC